MRWVGLSLIGFVELIIFLILFFLREGQMHTHMHYAVFVTHARLKSGAIHDAIGLFYLTNVFYFSTFLLHFIPWLRLKVDVFQPLKANESQLSFHAKHSTDLPSDSHPNSKHVPSNFKSQLKKGNYFYFSKTK